MMVLARAMLYSAGTILSHVGRVVRLSANAVALVDVRHGVPVRRLSSLRDICFKNILRWEKECPHGAFFMAENA